MGKIEFSNCQDVRNQKKIQELDKLLQNLNMD